MFIVHVHMLFHVCMYVSIHLFCMFAWSHTLLCMRCSMLCMDILVLCMCSSSVILVCMCMSPVSFSYIK